MKAYEITVKGWRGMRQIAAAKTAGQAKAEQYAAAREVDYNIPFIDFRARRAPQFDQLAAAHEGKRGPICLGWEDKVDGERYGCLAESEAAHAYP